MGGGSLAAGTMECEVGGERRRRRQRGEGQFIRKPFMSGEVLSCLRCGTLFSIPFIVVSFHWTHL